jgi:hypothetical protein
MKSVPSTGAPCAVAAKTTSSADKALNRRDAMSFS